MSVITADRDLWVNTMLTEELGFAPVPTRPLASAFTTFTAFLLIGMIPLAPFIFAHQSMNSAFAESILLTSSSFFAVVLVRRHVLERPRLHSGFGTLLTGGAAAALAYLVGTCCAVFTAWSEASPFRTNTRLLICFSHSTQGRLMRGVCLDIDTLDNGDLDRNPLHEAVSHWTYHAQTSADQLSEHIGSAEVLVTNKVLVDAPALAAASSLKLICVAATGTNNVDLEAARKRGIVVCNVRDYGTASVAEHTIGLMLALVRHLPDYARAVAEGAWTRAHGFSLYDFFPIGELNGRTLGIVGHGVLGAAVGRIAEGFGMRVLIAERRGQAPRHGRTEFTEVLDQADVLSLHCPLTPETRHLIGAEEIERLGPTGILINTARGGLVDSQALADALRADRLAAAGLDVLDEEPPPADHPLLSPDVPNLIVTPHVAWASGTARQRLIDEMALNMRAYLAGTPRNRVA